MRQPSKVTLLFHDTLTKIKLHANLHTKYDRGATTTKQQHLYTGTRRQDKQRLKGN
jgi:hypothetical protein